MNATITDATVFEVNPDDRTTTVECVLTCECGFTGHAFGVDRRALLTPKMVTVECPDCWTTHENTRVKDV